MAPTHYTAAQCAEMAGITLAALNYWEVRFDAVRPRLVTRPGDPHYRHYRAYDRWQVLRVQAIAALIEEKHISVAAAVAGADGEVVRWWRLLKQTRNL